MAIEIVKAVKTGVIAKCRGYEGIHQPIRLREVINSANFSGKFMELPTLPDSLRITAVAETHLYFLNDREVLKNAFAPLDVNNLTVAEQADLDSITREGLDKSLGLDEVVDGHIVVPAGETFLYRNRREKFISVKGNCILEAW